MPQARQQLIAKLHKQMRNIPDFPRKGIQFKDITPLLHKSETLRLTSQALLHPFLGIDIDYVLGLESRGFIFGPRLAQDLNAGFIPIRKPGKLPAETVSTRFQLEYGEDTIEMHKDAVNSGDRVLIHDDLIATGGSAAAATELVEGQGGKVVGYSFIVALESLKGIKKLKPNIPTDVLMHL